MCDGQTHGLVIGQNNSLEILPLNHRLKRMLDMWQDVSFHYYVFVLYVYIGLNTYSNNNGIRTLCICLDYISSNAYSNNNGVRTLCFYFLYWFKHLLF